MYAQAGFAIAQVKVKPHEIPSAIGFISLAQIGGSVFALAISNSVFLNKATTGILHILPNQPKGVIQGAISGAGSAFLQQLPPDTKRQVLVAVTNAIQRVYILAITGAALGIVLAPFLGNEKVCSLLCPLYCGLCWSWTWLTCAPSALLGRRCCGMII